MAHYKVAASPDNDLSKGFITFECDNPDHDAPGILVFDTCDQCRVVEWPAGGPITPFDLSACLSALVRIHGINGFVNITHADLGRSVKMQIARTKTGFQIKADLTPSAKRPVLLS